MSSISDPSGTRTYNFAQATRTATSGTSTAAVAFGALSASREVMFLSTERCWVVVGASDVAAADTANAGIIAVEAWVPWHMKLASGATHFRVIQDSTAGVLRTIPVA